MEPELSDLGVLARAYFGEDFRHHGASPDDLLRKFGRQEEAESARKASAEIRDVLRAATAESDLRQLWIDDYWASYDPTRDGMTYRQWFEHVLEVLAPFTTPPSASAD